MSYKRISFEGRSGDVTVDDAADRLKSVLDGTWTYDKENAVLWRGTGTEKFPIGWKVSARSSVATYNICTKIGGSVLISNANVSYNFANSGVIDVYTLIGGGVALQITGSTYLPGFTAAIVDSEYTGTDKPKTFGVGYYSNVMCFLSPEQGNINTSCRDRTTEGSGVGVLMAMPDIFTGAETKNTFMFYSSPGNTNTTCTISGNGTDRYTVCYNIALRYQ